MLLAGTALTQCVAGYGVAPVGYQLVYLSGTVNAGIGVFTVVGVNGWKAQLTVGEIDPSYPGGVTVQALDAGGNVVGAVYVDTIKVPVIGGNISQPDVDAIAAGLLDLTNGVEVGLTPRKVLRLMGAVLGGTVSLGGGLATFKGAGVLTNRVIATVPGDGSRPSVTLTL